MILAGDDRLQPDPVERLPQRRQLRQPVPAAHREGHRRHHDDVRHRRRRDRPLGRLGDGVVGAPCSPPLHEHDVPLASPSPSPSPPPPSAGLINGWCVARLGLPSLVVTLAGLIGWRGGARARRGPVDRRLPALVRPPRPGRPRRPAAAGGRAVLRALRRRVGGPHRSATGRVLYVIGDNAEVARYSGVNVVRTGSGCSSRRRSSPGLAGSSSPPASAPCAATWRPGSSWRSSRSCCSAA